MSKAGKGSDHHGEVGHGSARSRRTYFSVVELRELHDGEGEEGLGHGAVRASGRKGFGLK